MAAVNVLVKMCYSDSYLLVHRLKTVRENDTFEEGEQKGLKISTAVHTTTC
jgi:hypothetical protein